MKRYIVLFLCILKVTLLQAQDIDTTNKGTVALGEGLQFSLNEGAYKFKISGFIQPSYLYNKADTGNAQSKLRSKRTYLNFSGSAFQEKVSFFFQADFSAGTPLLDAYITYRPVNRWTISAGQMRTFTNNKEMTFNENVLQFSDRGLTSTAFTGNGREFGLFSTYRIGKQTGFFLLPAVAVTSGDGPNSFGANSIDVDYGGLKYGGRLDMYPLGDFSEGNRGLAQDIKHESKPKFSLGVSGSVNVGANDDKGEGHGTFRTFGDNGLRRYPNLRKLQADLLFKFKGFSLLSEYVTVTAAGLNGIYTDSLAAPTTKLVPQQISTYLVLGNAYNMQVGYVTKSGYALNARFEKVSPEFGSYPGNLLNKVEARTVGFSKYFRENALKIQLNYSDLRYQGIRVKQIELMAQVVF